LILGFNQSNNTLYFSQKQGHRQSECKLPKKKD
jgi:hypothetical protein